MFLQLFITQNAGFIGLRVVRLLFQQIDTWHNVYTYFGGNWLRQELKQGLINARVL
jgi:hypothetical protein